MSHSANGGFLMFDNIRFSGTTVNIPNYDFEYWESNVYYTLDNWWYGNKYSPDPLNPQNNPVSRTSDAKHGNYALLIQNFLYPNDTLSGYVSSSQYWYNPGFGVNSHHQSLTGYYKFIPENNDSMNIQVVMYKNHNQIGWGNLASTNTVTEYTPFNIDINYQSGLMPDSCQIIMKSSYNRALGNSKLYIDNLNFDGFLSGVKESPITETPNNFIFNVYPNPFSDNATISFALNNDENVMMRLFDLSGKQVSLLANRRYHAGNHNLDISAEGLKKGFYICVITSKNNNYSKKIVIQ
jgi:hypothetical protein